MKGLTYLFILCFSLMGLGLADYRYKLALWYDRRRTLITIGTLLVFFLAWDLSGVLRGIFFIGSSSLLTGIRVAPEVPIEEIVFLILMIYVTLLTWRFALQRQKKDKNV